MNWFYYLLFSAGIALAAIIILIYQRRKSKINERKVQSFIHASHEIQSALSLIITPLGKLLTEDFDDKSMKSLKYIQRNADRMSILVSRLLDVPNPEAGQIDLRFSEATIICPEKKQNPAVINMEEYPSGKRCSKLILIVDDDEEIRNYLRMLLSDDYRIIEAGTGEEALLYAANKQPDLIVSDVVMPGMDGFSFLKRLRANQNIAHLPVVLLTSKNEYKDKIDALAKGANACIAKPFNVDEFLLTISNLIRDRQLLKNKFSGIQDQEDKIKPVMLKSSDELLMDKIMIIINDNLQKPDFNVKMLASKLGLSRVQLYRKVKEMTSVPPGDFIRNIRLRQAALLLKENRMNISLISYSVGFPNQTHFSFAFKNFYGVSPTEYIRQSSMQENEK